ncbi:methyltransferase [Paenibacillus montaniterrae]|uniref:Methyltransferase n=1 Tax=Paenibacillus montaniterrae TaxID=429341 RepID=A0A920CUU6_9BACL|nr:class I SAM-dependent methyltransferase [Paenibacillus montaniterrae]GIP17407.1 methyltransferase [Paenibacillus montaniterrae]
MNRIKGSSPGVPSWDERYRESVYVYGEEANLFIQEASQFIASKSKVAAYAEGEGRNAVFLAGIGHEVVAYDYSQEGLRKTEALAAKNGVQVQTKQVDLIEEDLPIEQYDAAVMVFGHFPRINQYQVLNKIILSLKPGGCFLMEVYEEEQINCNSGGPKDVSWLYSATEMLKWSKQYRLKHFFTGEVERTEGLYHSGGCYVLQVVVEKLA